MEDIFPISALQRNQKEVKEAASHKVVRITEQGWGAYVFASEEAYEKVLAEAKEQGAYEARLYDAILAGQADIETGRVHHDLDGTFDELERSMEHRWK